MSDPLPPAQTTTQQQAGLVIELLRVFRFPGVNLRLHLPKVKALADAGFIDVHHQDIFMSGEVTPKGHAAVLRILAAMQNP